MLILRVALALDVPVLDCANDVCFVRFAELDLEFVAPIRLRVLEQKIEATSMGLTSLLVLQDQFTKTEKGRILSDPVLDPLLVELGVIPKGDPRRLDGR
jgi:hypothetical protein